MADSPRWHLREGRYGETTLDGLNVVAVGGFDGNMGSAEALTEPTTPEGARVQVHSWPGGSSNHFPFDWSGPDEP
jgi:hypothetical protein